MLGKIFIESCCNRIWRNNLFQRKFPWAYPGVWYFYWWRPLSWLEPTWLIFTTLELSSSWDDYKVFTRFSVYCMWNATFDSWQIIWWANDGVASWARTYVAVAAHSAVARAVQAAAPNWRQQWVYVRMHANPARSMGVPRLHITELLHCGWPLANATPSTSH